MEPQEPGNLRGRESLDSFSTLSEAQRHLALERFGLLRPFLEEGVALTEISRTLSISLRTLERWVACYRQQGLAGLVRKRRSDQGNRHLSEAMQKLVEGLALQKPPASLRNIHRQACSLAEQQGETPPGYWQVRDLVRHLSPALKTLAHEGTKAYQQRFDLIVRWEADAPNALWQADHTLLDIYVVREGQEPARPWLTTIIDDYSRAIAGYFLSFDAPSSLNTSLALRQAIWRKEDPRWHICGIPQILYTDNGSDFTSHHLQQVGADLKIRLIYSQPGQPRGRGCVERLFQTCNQMLLCTLPGYTQEGKVVVGQPSLTLTQLDGHFREFVLNTYHRNVHSETKMPPQARWEAGGFLPQMPESLEQLDLLLLTVAKSRKVHPDGIRFQGMRYMDINLAAYVGEEVTLRYDPRDMAVVRVFHEERFLCRAICQELAGETIPLREIIQARNRRRRELREVITDRQQIVQMLLQVHRPEPPREPASTSEEPPRPKLKRYYNE
jgi:putative transposase